MITINEYEYEIVKEFRDGFNEEALIARFSDVLSKYDYILGDWGYGQLRLKGFFEDRNPKSTYETKISTLQDYIYEYCNFGCAYFVLQKVGKAKKQTTEQE
ncbi:YutD family protein [Sporosarcina highlanderae]|uniref:YutD family protein n=1 Tax=Sporosarcina highlanderae TaxID=3035916 RepID=A0ABT8JV88_9BACL|nr:YutD family protein [Sporosarcina highlanderae]MDN4609060.1 YutD family protein [Sporosarcina highlanderae]